jgi:hypothetical protein
MTPTELRAQAGAFFAVSLLFTGALLLTAGFAQADARAARFERCVNAGGLAGQCERAAYGF